MEKDKTLIENSKKPEQNRQKMKQLEEEIAKLKARNEALLKQKQEASNESSDNKEEVIEDNNYQPQPQKQVINSNINKLNNPKI